MVPDLTGRTVIVTGANAGLGFETARVLSGHGAYVVLACRDQAKAEQAAQRLSAADGNVGVETLQLDLASLSSVRDAASAIRSAHDRLDLLVNNAGVMDVPAERTEDGFELTLGTNHLGPFALTGLLLELLLATPGSRVVTVSSLAHARGRIDLDDLNGDRGYEPPVAYAQSKLANLMFTFELDRRLRTAGAATMALASHPGIVPTELFKHSSWFERAAISPRLRPLNFWLAQSVEAGAQPTLRAAVDPAAEGGQFYGPHGRFGTGSAAPVEPSHQARDEITQAELWEASERLTGVTYPFGPATQGG
jgi:NAD(P)-dependent dehydrogenase (short-subunit alcohol dehydrogenase family)